MKVEKTAERIGLYLCCGSDGDEPRASAATVATTTGTATAQSTAPDSGPTRPTTPATGIESKSTPTLMPVGRWPIAVDYQLMVRGRGNDEARCCSVVFRTEFGREKAW